MDGPPFVRRCRVARHRRGERLRHAAAHDLPPQVIAPHVGGDPKQIAAQVTVGVEPWPSRHQPRSRFLQQLGREVRVAAPRAEEVAQRRGVLGEQGVGRGHPA